MLIKQLADTTGTTVPAIRNYIKQGLLQEPPRDENGYRHFSFNDVITVLHIKQLASIGIKLHDVPEFIDHEPNENNIDSLIKDIEEEIRQNQERIEILELLKKNNMPLDIPAEYCTYLTALKKHGASYNVIDLNRSYLLIITQALDNHERELKLLQSIYDKFAHNDVLIKAYIKTYACFEKITDTSTDEDCEEATRRNVDLLIRISEILEAIQPMQEYSGITNEAFVEIDKLTFNDRQIRIKQEAKRRFKNYIAYHNQESSVQ